VLETIILLPSGLEVLSGRRGTDSAQKFSQITCQRKDESSENFIFYPLSTCLRTYWIKETEPKLTMAIKKGIERLYPEATNSYPGKGKGRQDKSGRGKGRQQNLG
jgi:hypothetical protein